MSPRALLVPVAALWVAVTAQPSFAEAPPPMTLPQVRIDAVDTEAWPHLRVMATVLDAAGRPVPPRALKQLRLVDASRPSAPPIAHFRQGQPDAATPSARMQTRDKAGRPLAAMVVVAGYQHEQLREGALGQRLKDALGAGWKQFAPGDRVNVVWYGDRLYRFHALPGRAGALDDVELRRRACADALAQARSGELPPPGTWACGLQDDPKTVGARVKQAPFVGHFPRLFALGAPFDDVGRYCAPPPEALAGFGPFTVSNARTQKDAAERAASRGLSPEFTTSAFEEALQTLLMDARPGEAPVLLLVSDGRDGYFRELELCQAHPPQSCAALGADASAAGKAKANACITDFLAQRMAASQAEFKARAAHWLGLLRAAGIRVFAVGLGSTGRDFELERLRLLAERSGGTWRLAQNEDDVGPALLTTMAELSGQLVLEVDDPSATDAPRPDERRLALDVELDPALARVRPLLPNSDVGDPQPKLRSAPWSATIAPAPSAGARLRALLRAPFVRAQGVLGYPTYLLVARILVSVGALLAVLLAVLGSVRRLRTAREKRQE